MIKAWTRSGFLSAWSNTVVDDLRGMRIAPSSDIVPSYIPGMGVLLHNAKTSGASATEIETAWEASALTSAGVGVDLGAVTYGVSVPMGPVYWGASPINSTWASWTVAGGGVQMAVAYPGVTASRLLYIEVDLNATGEKVQPKWAAATTAPNHNVTGGNLVFNFPISVWSIATTSGVSTGTRLFKIPQTVTIPGWAPPRA